MLEDCSSSIYDYLQISDGEELDGQRLFCESEENNATNFVSSTNQLRLQFVSDSSVTAKGFNLTWQFKDVACISGVIIPKDNRSSGIISSPNYPDNYYINLNCNWTIQAPEDKVIAVRFVYFMLEDCSSSIYDYLQISDGEELDGQRLFCESEENNAKNFVSSTNQLRLRFVSDSSVTAKGFNLTWQFKDVACISGVIIPKDNRSSGIISSPNYPDNYYNNLNCNWTIQAPEDKVIAVRFVYFMLEDCSSSIYDYLQINDGEELDGQRLFCQSEENNAKNFVSSTNQLRLRFVSDSSVTAKGFNLTWQFKGSCPENQVYSTCAGCDIRCENIFDPPFCPAVCMEKCTCPNGTVLNGQRCVPPDQCPSGKCDLNPCGIGGDCESISEPPGFQCACDLGFSGSLCDVIQLPAPQSFDITSSSIAVVLDKQRLFNTYEVKVQSGDFLRIISSTTSALFIPGLEASTLYEISSRGIISNDLEIIADAEFSPALSVATVGPSVQFSVYISPTFANFDVNLLDLNSEASARLEYEVNSAFAHFVASDGSNIPWNWRLSRFNLVSIVQGSIIASMEVIVNATGNDAADTLLSALQNFSVFENVTVFEDIPSPPNVTITEVTLSQVSGNLSEVDGAISYKVSVTCSSEFSETESFSTTSFVFTGLNPDDSCLLSVRAKVELSPTQVAKTQILSIPFTTGSCPENQVYSTCAGCDIRCENISVPQFCPAVCMEKCTCPNGTVLNGQRCVPPDQCPSGSCHLVSPDDLALLPKCTLVSGLLKVRDCLDNITRQLPFLQQKLCHNAVDAAIACLADELVGCLEGDCPTILDFIPELRDAYRDIQDYASQISSLGDIFEILNDTLMAGISDEFIYNLLCPLPGSVIPQEFLEVIINIPPIVLENPVCSDDIISNLIHWGFDATLAFYEARKHEDICFAFGNLKKNLMDAWEHDCDEDNLRSFLYSVLPSDLNYLVPLIHQGAEIMLDFLEDWEIPNCFQDLPFEDLVTCFHGTRVFATNRETNFYNVVISRTCHHEDVCAEFRWNNIDDFGKPSYIETAFCYPSFLTSNASCDILMGSPQVGDISNCTFEFCAEEKCNSLSGPPVGERITCSVGTNVFTSDRTSLIFTQTSFQLCPPLEFCAVFNWTNVDNSSFTTYVETAFCTASEDVDCDFLSLQPGVGNISDCSVNYCRESLCNLVSGPPVGKQVNCSVGANVFASDRSSLLFTQTSFQLCPPLHICAVFNWTNVDNSSLTTYVETAFCTASEDVDCDFLSLQPGVGNISDCSVNYCRESLCNLVSGPPVGERVTCSVGTNIFASDRSSLLFTQTSFQLCPPLHICVVFNWTNVDNSSLTTYVETAFCTASEDVDCDFLSLQPGVGNISDCSVNYCRESLCNLVSGPPVGKQVNCSVGANVFASDRSSLLFTQTSFQLCPPLHICAVFNWTNVDNSSLTTYVETAFCTASEDVDCDFLSLQPGVGNISDCSVNYCRESLCNLVSGPPVGEQVNCSVGTNVYTSDRTSLLFTQTSFQLCPLLHICAVFNWINVDNSSLTTYVETAFCSVSEDIDCDFLSTQPGVGNISSCSVNFCRENLCNLFSSGVCPNILLSDILFLPQCTLKATLDQVFNCLDLFVVNVPYQNQGQCRSTIDETAQCLARLTTNCLQGNCSSIFDFLPNARSGIMDARSLTMGISSLADALELLDVDSRDIELIHELLCPAIFGGNLPQNVSTFIQSIPSFREPNPLCDDYIVDDIIEATFEALITFHEAKDHTDACRAFNIQKGRYFDLWENSCNQDILGSLLLANIPEQYHSFIQLIFSGKNIVENYLNEVEIPLCPPGKCDLNPCGIGGDCKSISEPPGFQCACDPGFSGSLCDVIQLPAPQLVDIASFSIAVDLDELGLFYTYEVKVQSGDFLRIISSNVSLLFIPGLEARTPYEISSRGIVSNDLEIIADAEFSPALSVATAGPSVQFSANISPDVISFAPTLENFEVDLLDPKSIAYIRLESDIVQLFTRFVTSDATETSTNLLFSKIKILSIRPGSIIASMEVIVNTTGNDAADIVLSVLQNSSVFENVTVFEDIPSPPNVTITKVTLSQVSGNLSEVDGAISYKVSVTCSSEFSETESFSTTSFVFTGLNPDDSCLLSVRAIVELSPTQVAETDILSIPFTTGSSMEGIECSGNPLISLTSDQLLSLGLQPGGHFIVSQQSSQSVENSEEADERCIGSYENPSLTMNITSCGAVLEDTGTFIKVIYTVRNLPDLGDFSIARHKDNCFNVTCFLQKEILIESNEIVPVIRKILQPVQTFEGDLYVTIEFYQDDTFGEILEKNSNVFVMDYINVGISFVNPVEEAFILQATRCWATLTPNAGAPYVYVIIDDSCPARNEFDETGSIDVVENYQSNSVYFRFKAFVWTGVSLDSQAIYVHCAVTVCYNDTTSHCTDLSCPVSRKRRNSENDIMTATVSSKPIFLQTKEPTCLKDNGGCSDVCDMREGKVVCSCHSGRKILEDGKSCQAAIARARDDTAMHFVLGIKALELQKLYGFILLVVLFALVVAFSFWKTRRI
ncbi:unnamed protein product [Clavelina lepadiformis]|uniref:Uncharacterized protein n=1 Tax=Clavelina lepadiformis TaxID=159417 RepID=A0ABP0GRW7_CLALP